MQETGGSVTGHVVRCAPVRPQLTALSPDHAVMTAPVSGGERIEEIASGLLDVLPQRFALAGLSMGGIVAMEILRRAADRGHPHRAHGYQPAG